MELPIWLNAAKIGGLVVLCLAFVQYFKQYIPEKKIRLFAVGVGIILSIAYEIYVGNAFVGITHWVKAFVDGTVAAILADLGYGFLSKTAGRFTLPSKADITKEGEKDEEET
jgi:hypothetical protein